MSNTIKSTITVIASLFLLNCSAGNGSKSDMQVSQSENYRYSYAIGGCFTRPRMAISTDQLCKNLQLESANENCAINARKQYFDQKCSGYSWSPTNLQQQVYATTGLDCQVLPGAGASGYMYDGGYTTTQYVIDATTVVPHEAFIALIDQSVAGNSITVSIKLMTSYPTGDLIAQKTSYLLAGQSILLETSSPKARVVCKAVIQ